MADEYRSPEEYNDSLYANGTVALQNYINSRAGTRKQMYDELKSLHEKLLSTQPDSYSKASEWAKLRDMSNKINEFDRQTAAARNADPVEFLTGGEEYMNKYLNSPEANTTSANNNTDSKFTGAAKNIASNAGDIFASGLASWAVDNINRGVDKSGMSTGLREQAAQHDEEAAQDQKFAEQESQIANRDYRVEAGKNAAAEAAFKNAQTVQNMGAASGNAAAALARTVGNPDYNTQMNRTDEARERAKKNYKSMYSDRQVGIQERTKANTRDYDDRRLANYNAATAALSLANGAQEQPQPQQNTPQPQAEAREQPQQNTLQPQAEAQEQGQPSGNPQHVINWLLGHEKGQDIMQSKDAALAKWVSDKYGVEPVELNHYRAENNNPAAWQALYERDYGDAAVQAMQALREGRAGKEGRPEDNFVDTGNGYVKDGPNFTKMNENVTATLSGIRY